MQTQCSTTADGWNVSLFFFFDTLDDLLQVFLWKITSEHWHAGEQQWKMQISGEEKDKKTFGIFF